jgi:hypothetical protein
VVIITVSNTPAAGDQSSHNWCPVHQIDAHSLIHHCCSSLLGHRHLPIPPPITSILLESRPYPNPRSRSRSPPLSSLPTNLSPTPAFPPSLLTTLSPPPLLSFSFHPNRFQSAENPRPQTSPCVFIVPVQGQTDLMAF